MVLIVGLGNPGKKYQRTRHNLGFMVVDKLQQDWGFLQWKNKKKFNAEISETSEGILRGQKITLAKPQTFMNQSGKTVKKLVTGYRLQVTGIWVIHDDLDLPLGKIKITKNRGAAGHKGVQSIINEIGSKNFVRFRLGIAQKLKVKNEKLKVKVKSSKLNQLVLQNFNKEEEKTIKKVIEKTCQAIEATIENGVEKAMNKFNK